MAHILAELSPRDPVLDTRPTVRVCDVQDRRVTGLDGQTWYPAITTSPALAIRLFDGDFSSDIEPGSANIALALGNVLDANAGRYLWAGAKVSFYAGEAGQAWPWDRVFTGKVQRWEATGRAIKLTASVDTEPFEADALTLTYAGTTGIEGDANLKNKVKPWVFGHARNVEPVLINAVDNVYQFSAYGPIEAVNALYERGASFGAAEADYDDYDALVAATIPNGGWATCLAQGLVRLGAPAYGVITGDVDGHVEDGDWLRMTGEIIACIASRAGVDAGLIDTDSLDALDTAIAGLCPDGGTINLVLTEQETVLDLARRLARPCNAQAGVSWLGKLFTTRVAIGTPAITLDAQGRRLPLVLESTEVDVSPPYWRIQMGAARAWRVHSFEEIATYAPLVDRGPYVGTAIYRDGNFVQDQGRDWLYINAEPSSGNAPPTLPTAANAHWRSMAPTTLGDLDGEAGDKLDDIEDHADVTKEIVGPTSGSVTAKADGTFETGVLPFVVGFKLIDARETDRTDDATWAAVKVSGSATFDDPMDVEDGEAALNVTALDTTTVFEVQATIDGIIVARLTYRLTKVIGSGGTGSGGTGGTTDDGAIAGSNGTTSYVAISPVIQVTAGAAGQVACTAPIEYVCTNNVIDASISSTAKWQWRTVGGSFADITTPIAATSPAAVTKSGPTYEREPGYIPCNMTKSGLSTGTDYEFQLFAKVDEASRDCVYSGLGGAAATCTGT